MLTVCPGYHDIIPDTLRCCLIDLIICCLIFKLRGQAPVNKNLATNEEIAADPVAAAMAKVSTDCSVAQPIIDMSGYWDAATPFGDAFQNGAEGQITKDNAAQKTEDFNTQLNDSLK